MATDATTTAAAAPVELGAVSVPALLPSPTSPPSRRTDLVSLKLRLAELLTPEQGTLYWSGLADFFTGRINRNEWDEIMKRAFGRDRTKRQQARESARLAAGADCGGKCELMHVRVAPQSSCTTPSSSRSSTTPPVLTSRRPRSAIPASTPADQRSEHATRRQASWKRSGNGSSKMQSWPSAAANGEKSSSSEPRAAAELPVRRVRPVQGQGRSRPKGRWQRRMRNGNGNAGLRRRSAKRSEGPVVAEEDQSLRTGCQPLYSRVGKIRQACQVSRNTESPGLFF